MTDWRWDTWFSSYGERGVLLNRRIELLFGSGDFGSCSCRLCLQIFTEDIPEVEALPREDVLDYLEKTSPDLVIPYLVCISPRLFLRESLTFVRRQVQCCSSHVLAIFYDIVWNVRQNLLGIILISGFRHSPVARWESRISQLVSTAVQGQGHVTHGGISSVFTRR